MADIYLYTPDNRRFTAMSASGNDQEVYPGFLGTSRHSSQDRGKIISEAKGIRNFLWRCVGNNSQYTDSSNGRRHPFRASISETERSPRGKRAFLCGVSYKGQKFKLKGAINDVRSMKDLLVKQFSFPDDSILILSEEEPYMYPTRKNIEGGFKWLTRDLQFGDSVVFYFSGHGLRQLDFDRDEKDGFHKTICPVDFQTEGMIFDNHINETIVRPLQQGVTLHTIVDSCHSGTVLDLPLVYKKNEEKWDDNRPLSGAPKGTNGGKAICFSACEDYQQAADTSALSPEKAMTGAMTYTFVKAVKDAITNNQIISYRGILDSMNKTLDKDNIAGCLHPRISRLFQRKIFQEPLLSSSEEFNINTEFKL
ncbi:metacaspase-1-like isoform X2 [Olea europaea var. sylvestris]|uniref:metacaspase-1-like isoform X2 n=1 Tax=Olea europaea var. sylvestris TaxID=158386 RepID=UPI000C1D7EDE|nr:metacaspase-1-like isoform X2 [Olea europaea var. sylvestris]